MARYINAEKTIEIINSEIEQCKLELEDEEEEEEAYTRAVNARLLGLITCLAIIKSQPTADVVEVVHAERIEQHGEYVCSCCGGLASLNAYKKHIVKDFYCRSCGAKMDGQKREEK